jgi:hypothetical protein
LWLRKPPTSSKINSLQRPARNKLNINHLKTASFSRFQYGLESGSGPGGRRFKSSLPDQSFQAHKAHFWFFVYSDVDDFVAVKTSKKQQQKILAEKLLTLQTLISMNSRPDPSLVWK